MAGENLTFELIFQICEMLITYKEWQMCSSCHIRRLKKRWNCRGTWNICFIFNFQLKKIRSKIIQITLIELWSFISFELRHLNSMKMSQKAKFGCSIFQLKIKRKQIFQVRHQFGHFVKCRIWHEKHIRTEVRGDFNIHETKKF